MTPEAALALGKERVREQGQYGYKVRHRQIIVPANTEGQRLSANKNEYWYVISADRGIRIQSSLGIYDTDAVNMAEPVHEHNGNIIKLTNYAAEQRQVEFLIVYITYPPSS